MENQNQESTQVKKIVAPIKTKIAAIWLIVVVALSALYFFYKAFVIGAQVVVLIPIAACVAFAFLCIWGLLIGKKLGWYGIVVANFLANFFFISVLVYSLFFGYIIKAHTLSAYFAYLYFATWFLIYFIPFILLIIDRKNYFAAVDNSKK